LKPREALGAELKRGVAMELPLLTPRWKLGAENAWGVAKPAAGANTCGVENVCAPAKVFDVEN
jgi:hypothetical protein